MKNIIAVLFCTIIMTSCSLSKEEKAEKLVKETLNDYLFYPDSYEPISTTVDSMFIDVTTIEPILEISDEIKDLVYKIVRCQEKIESAEFSMNLWAPDGYDSQYSRGNFNRAKEEKEEAKSDLDRYTTKLPGQIASLKDYVAKFYKGKFTGWLVSHRFRSLNGAGSMTIPGEMLFFCDEEFTNCDYFENSKLNRLTKILKTVNDASSDEDIVDYFKDNIYIL